MSDLWMVRLIFVFVAGVFACAIGQLAVDWSTNQIDPAHYGIIVVAVVALPPAIVLMNVNGITARDLIRRRKT